MTDNKVVYIAGPYSGKYHDWRSYCEIECHINSAREAAIWCASNRIFYFSPHLHSQHNEVIMPDIEVEYWYKLDLIFAKTCQAILLLPGWEYSKGTKIEFEVFAKEGKRTFEFPEDNEYLLQWARGK